jgi:hypothetical protein
MRRLMILFVFLLCSFSGKAYTSGIAISTSKSSVVQVFINGKLYNKAPSSFIRIRSTEGTFHLKLKILNLQSRTWQEVIKTVHIVKGFEYSFSIVHQEGKKPELIQIKRYPIYSKYFLNYSLYTRGHTS